MNFVFALLVLDGEFGFRGPGKGLKKSGIKTRSERVRVRFTERIKDSKSSSDAKRRF